MNSMVSLVSRDSERQVRAMTIDMMIYAILISVVISAFITFGVTVYVMKALTKAVDQKFARMPKDIPNKNGGKK